uniref:Ricin B lectin domain-containing protein n=1 Tax=Zooxanthella nutricula TaxID=1333877 RepID=A0A6V0A5P6_9DINO|mmetsp:Transcript_35739/g.108008  ORF Transcript_35739/g.108008 Transcript_35739/m.108008 type:complete len:172 (+) Transcript_35739:76-591(+)
MASFSRAAVALLLVPRALGASMCMAGPPTPIQAPAWVQPCVPVTVPFKQWDVESEGAAQTISLLAGKFCLDLADGKTDNGNAVGLWECNGLPNQQWLFASDTWQIKYYADQSKCVDAGDMSPGSQLQIWDCNDTPQQHWGYDTDQHTIYLSDSSRRLRGQARSPEPAGFAV